MSYKLLSGAYTTVTNVAWKDMLLRDWLEKNKPKVIKKVRKNARKRRPLTVHIKRAIKERSKGYCEECGEVGKAVHHIIPIRLRDDLQHDLNNLIYLCIPCHRNRHPNLPEFLFI